jgi:hypothetical protein
MAIKPSAATRPGRRASLSAPLHGIPDRLELDMLEVEYQNSLISRKMFGCGRQMSDVLQIVGEEVVAA